MSSAHHVLVHCVSFGFKHGLPKDLNTFFDVRCFKNPHYEAHLTHLTGLDPLVKESVFSDPGVLLFVSKVADLVSFLYPRYLAEGRTSFFVGIGCTGGKHRSVAIAQELAQVLKQSLPVVCIEHRHIQLS